MPPQRFVITFDASEITSADEAVLDALARLQLAARRIGITIELVNAPPTLVDLLLLVGLASELLGVEVDGQTEEREQVGIDEEVDRGDHAV